MQSLGRRLATVGAGVAAVVLTTVTLASPESAAGYATTTDPVKAAGGWLSTQFVNGTHLPAPNGDHLDQSFGDKSSPNYGATVDVLFGLAAAKTASPVAQKALQYLATNVDAYTGLSDATYGPYDGSIGKLAVAVEILGKDPMAFGGVNLLQRLKDDECTEVASDKGCNTVGSAKNIFSSISEAFVLLAESRGPEKSAPSPAALEYFTSLQCDNGGFTVKTTDCTSNADADLDSTSYAVMALSAVGGHKDEVDAAVDWLQARQKSGGYWVNEGSANPNSTGLAAAALHGAGENVSKARSWLRAQQVPAGKPGAGAIKYAGTLTPTTTSATSPSVLATAQALTGLADDGSLATLTAGGSDDEQHLFAPVVSGKSTVVSGGKQSVRGAGFVAGEKVRVVVHSDPVRVATATADPVGVVRASFTVPASVPAGAHSIVLTGATSGLSAQQGLTITAAPGAGGGTPPPSGGTATPPGSADPIAATGTDGGRLSGTIGVGAAAVLVGGLLLVAGRRRVSR